MELKLLTRVSLCDLYVECILKATVTSLVLLQLLHVCMMSIVNIVYSNSTRNSNLLQATMLNNIIKQCVR